MNIDQLIHELEFIKSIHGNITITLDSLYTPASQPVDGVYVEPRSGDNSLNEKVVVIRN